MKRPLSSLLESSEHLIFYRAQTQYDNLGDLIINRILINKLRSYGNLVVDLRDVPDWYDQQLELTDAERANQYQWKFNYLLLFAAVRSRLSGKKGKVYLIEPPGHRYGKLSWQQLKIALISLVHYSIFRLVGIRICMLGVSIGPFSKTLDILEYWRSKLLYFYSLRDSLSQNYAHQIGIKQVTRFPDLAWLMDSPTDESQTLLLPKGDYVIFSFRSQTHSLAQSSDYQQQLYQTLDSIAELVCCTWAKKLVITYQVEMDQPFCQHLAERYSTLYNVLFVKERVDLDSMQHIYSGAFMVFSNRLHVLMLALIYGSIPIAVIDRAKHNKITGIFQDAGLNRLLIDLDKDSDKNSNEPPDPTLAKDCSDKVDPLAVLSSLAEVAPEIRHELATCCAQARNTGNTLLQKIMDVGE